MKTIVLINGEAQSGKSTMAEHLANLLFANGIIAGVYSFVGPYRPMLQSLAEFMSADAGSTPYEDLKRERLVPGLPFTGRDWLIQVGNASRALHPYFLPAIFAEHARNKGEMIDVWIIENWGFADEKHFFEEPFTKELLGGFRLLTVSLTERSTRKYEAGETYDGDNRANQEVLADMVNPRVNEIAAAIDPEHAYPLDTIDLQFNHTEVHESPEPASEFVDPIQSEIEEVSHEVDGPDADDLRDRQQDDEMNT